MKTLRKAAQMALDFIEDLPSTPETYSLCRELNKALALPDAQPVAEWVLHSHFNIPRLRWAPGYKAAVGNKLYAAPQPAIAPEKLTQDEILNMAEGVTLQFHDLLTFARAIEAACHAKQTGSKP